MQDSDFMILGSFALVVWWIGAASAVQTAADKRGYSPKAWFWLSLFIGPPFAVLLLIAYPRFTEGPRR